MKRSLPKINPNQPIAVDVETCDPELKFSAPGFISKVGFVAGIAVATETESYYLPIHHAKGYNYDEKEVVDWLNEVLSADTDKIFHNSQYDMGWLNYIGVQLHGRVFDTMLAAPLLNENRFSYTLDSLGKIYCGEGKFEEALKMAVAEEFDGVRTKKAIIRLKEDVPCMKYKPFFDAKKRTSQLYDLWPQEVKDRYEYCGFEVSKIGQKDYLVPHKRNEDIKGLLWACDAESMGTYPIQDVELTFKLYKIFKKELEKEGLTKLMELENELVAPLLETRLQGVRIDMPRSIELDQKYTAELDALQTKLNTLAGFEVDVNIDDDLIKICDKFNLKYAKTEKGNPSFKAEVAPKDDMGIFETVLKIRNYFKARDTYIRGYIFGCTIDGWLHGQYNQLKSDEGGTITGRLSSSCIAEGTPIALPGGYKNIEDIEPGDQVYCYREDGTVTISEVLNKFDKGIKPCVELKWQSSGNGQTGSLICTPDHLIKTKREGWVPAGKLKRYDKLYHLKRALQANGRYRLYGANCYMENEEQCIKREYFKADSKMHIHQISYNHTVSSVRPVGDRHVWDIEVKDHHNFIAGEICVHNCPNMQNLPNPKSSQIGKDIRGLFLPDSEDEMWLSMDYSGQEPKMLVHTVIALDKAMRKIGNGRADVEYVPGAKIAQTDEFRSRKADFHTAVAAICMKQECNLMHLNPTPEEFKKMVKDFRPKAKSIGLGVMYGSGDGKIAEEMTKKGFPMTKTEASDIRRNIYSGVPFLSYISDYLMKKAERRGYILTILKRRGRFDLWECPMYDKEKQKEIKYANFGFPSQEKALEWYNENRRKYDIQAPKRASAYKALNKYIQGSSADQTKTAMLHLYKKGNLELNALDIFYRRIPKYAPPKFKTQVHDELNLSITKGENVQQYQYIMEHCIPLEVEVVADPVVCTRWSEAK